MERDKQLTQQQLLIIDHNKKADAVYKSIKKLEAKKNELLFKINSPAERLLGADVYDDTKSLYANLEEIRAKNAEMEQKTRSLKYELGKKNAKFAEVKQQIDADFSHHVS